MIKHKLATLWHFCEVPSQTFCNKKDSEISILPENTLKMFNYKGTLNIISVEVSLQSLYEAIWKLCSEQIGEDFARYAVLPIPVSLMKTFKIHNFKIFNWILDKLSLTCSRNFLHLSKPTYIRMDFPYKYCSWILNKFTLKNISLISPYNNQKYIYTVHHKKTNWELSMFYHSLITLTINKWHIFVKLSSSSFIWCNSSWVIKKNLKKGYQKVIQQTLFEFQGENHISGKFIFSPFLWHLNQEKWARNNKVLFV